MRTNRTGIYLGKIAGALVLWGASTQAVASQEGVPVDTATPGAHYEASGFYRFLFGSSYRDLWTTPVTVEVLDLRSTGGGLTPTGTGRGQQTLNLRFIPAKITTSDPASVPRGINSTVR